MSDLFKIAMSGDLEALKSAEVGSLHVKNEMGSTLLFYAVMCDDPQVLQYLRNAGLLVNAQRKDGETPLHIACIRNKLNAARWLLANGADPELKDQWSRRPIDCLGKGGEEIRKLLEPLAQDNIDRPLLVDEFKPLLVQRLRDRWKCTNPKGFSDDELRECYPNIELPAIFHVFLNVCGKEMGLMFRSYELVFCDSIAAQNNFEGFLKAFSLTIEPAMHFLNYLREEYWAFARTRTHSEFDDPHVLHITVDGVQPKSIRLSQFFLTWEQFE